MKLELRLNMTPVENFNENVITKTWWPHFSFFVLTRFVTIASSNPAENKTIHFILNLGTSEYQDIKNDVFIIVQWSTRFSKKSLSGILKEKSWNQYSVGALVPKSEAVAKRCSTRKVFLKISQNSQKNTCVRVSWILRNF